ncbi:type II toxin-antitoxin system RatA family toxin [Candidatus Deianiraea vastatrix]|uniref:Polyketide cyclase / dehydrase-like protein n=1 Tax=Candidatus Deianiraea vastatrix TaxID=2163644 RepID=A0A5B8XDP0_9RICK|nr:SRPBCC family protein [Candidatus Deianiraea vastatrix]QED23350.1 Putative polyketide cyclase / dehydrase-like protein [Candidatus Deianiraea vastatrix]
MLKISQQKRINADLLLVKSVILDVEKYNEFLPWCDVKVVNKGNFLTKTDVAIDLSLFKYRFSCEIQENDNEIKMRGKKFMQFEFFGVWKLKEIDGICEVSFEIEIDFTLSLIEEKVRDVANAKIHEIMSRFEERINTKKEINSQR